MEEKRRCPQCGAEIAEGDDLCRDCGTILDGSTPLVTTPDTEETAAAEEPSTGVNKLLVVKNIKEETGADLILVKNAVDECNGDYDKALALVRERMASTPQRTAEEILAEADEQEAQYQRDMEQIRKTEEEFNKYKAEAEAIHQAARNRNIAKWGGIAVAAVIILCLLFTCS